MMAYSRCADVVAALSRDPRLRVIPLGARALFVLVADMLEQFPERAFCLGSRPASVAEISLLVSAPETEVETHLKTLIEFGLLIRRATDGALMRSEIPPADEASAARQNGSLGGRPRSGETSDEARTRRSQGHLKLPIKGGRLETQETQEKPSHGNQTRAHPATTTTTTTTTTVPKELTQQSREVSALGADMGTVAGLRQKPGGVNLTPIAGWLNDGISESLIRATITNVAGRESYVAHEVHSFRYFEKAIREAHDKLRQSSDSGVKERADQWEEWINSNRNGPAPALAA
jgi:hypothetical protein